jgi:hypothetical protein
VVVTAVLTEFSGSACDIGPTFSHLDLGGSPVGARRIANRTKRRLSMFRKWIPGSVGAAIAVAAIAAVWASNASAAGQSSSPMFDPNNFVANVNNPYYPLPVGRTLVYSGIKDGQTQRDTVRITNQTKVILGVTATVVSDVADHNGAILEKTSDWYAQDKQGNVWYLGEDTVHYLANGKGDTSGSWEAGVNGAVPGIIMEANPQIPDAYRQELFAGQAEDTAWIVDRGGTVSVPYGKVKNVLTTLEATRLEPGAYDQKVYGPGLGIILEQSLSGPNEYAKLESVTGP